MPKIDVDNPRIGFGRVKIEVDGKEILAKSISYGDGLERTDIEGNARMALGVTDGVYRADEGEITVYAEEYAEILDAFGDDFYGKPFTVSVTFEQAKGGGGSSKLTKDELIGCRWTKRGVSDETGPDGLTRTLGFKPLYIKAQGKNPLKDMPQGAK